MLYISDARDRTQRPPRSLDRIAAFGRTLFALLRAVADRFAVAEADPLEIFARDFVAERLVGLNTRAKRVRLQSSGFSPRCSISAQRCLPASCWLSCRAGAVAGASLIEPSGLNSCGAPPPGALSPMRARIASVSSCAACGGGGSSTFGASTRTLVCFGVNGGGSGSGGIGSDGGGSISTTSIVCGRGGGTSRAI